MEEEITSSVLEFIPGIGDLYRAGKLGYKIGSFLNNNSATDELLSKLIDKINDAYNSESLNEAYEHLCDFSDLIQEYDGNLKYQHAIAGYLSSKGMHLLALCHWSSNAYDPIELEKTMEYFNNALACSVQVIKIETTWLTDNRNFVKEMKSLAMSENTQIQESISKYKKHVKALDKALHPWKYRLRWMIPLVIIIITGFVILILFLNGQI